MSHPSLCCAIGTRPRGYSNTYGVQASWWARYATDPIGTTTVTFSGVNAGSEIRVYLPDGTALAGVESCDANHVLTWDVYPAGANSTVTIRIVNTAYRIKEFTYTPTVGAASLPVQQEVDKWYSNPV